MRVTTVPSEDPAWTSPSMACMHVTGVEKKRHLLTHLCACPRRRAVAP